MSFRETGHADSESARIWMCARFVESPNKLHQIDRVLKRVSRFVVRNLPRPITPERGGGPGYLTHDRGMSANPRYLRENNVGISASEVEQFPRDRIFIAPEDGSSDVFVHQSDIDVQGYRELTEGQRVEFSVEAGQKGPKAAKVRPV